MTRQRSLDEDEVVSEPHLLIAGTGRAGTSFLVRFLTEIGLDTSLRRQGDKAFWNEAANAGLEDLPVPPKPGTAPYVIKSPWLYQYVDSVLADRSISIDAVVIPVRDLAEAASSRTILERRAIYEAAPWMTGIDTVAEAWCNTPGGVIYSLNPIDQGRLLAVGLHHLLQRLVDADVPVILLSFPRLANDPAYLFDKLRPVLPSGVRREAAIAAHRRVADPAKVRVGEELDEAARGAPAPVMGYQNPEALDAIALRRELQRLHAELRGARKLAAHHERCATGAESAGQALEVERDALRRHLGAAEAARDQAIAAAAQNAQAHAEAATALHSAVVREQAEHARLQADNARLQRQLSELQQDAAHRLEHQAGLQRELEQLRHSRSWRLTRPYRAIGARLQRLLHPT